jgi:peptidylprolyl isomerase
MALLPPGVPTSVDYNNPIVFFDIAIDGALVGRISMELFMESCPRTVENFRALCTGEKGFFHGRPMCYKGTPFHHIATDLVCQGGDYMNHDGTGGASIYGELFEDETYDGRAGSHFGFGCLSMAKQRHPLSGSQFFFCLQPMHHLDGKNVVFGRVIRGLEILKQMNAAGTPSGAPARTVVVAQCGQES